MSGPKGKPAVAHPNEECLGAFVVFLDCRSTVAVTGDELPPQFKTQSQLEVCSLGVLSKHTQQVDGMPLASINREARDRGRPEGA